MRHPGGKKYDIQIVAINDLGDARINAHLTKHDTAHTVISNASCTTNWLAPRIKLVHEKTGQVNGRVTTIHAYTNDLVLTDVHHEDRRRARRRAQHDPDPDRRRRCGGPGAAGTERQARRLRDRCADDQRVGGRAVLHCHPRHEGRRDQRDREGRRRRRAEEHLGYKAEPLVSSDFNHDPRSSLFEATPTKVSGRLVKVSSWYDSEWGSVTGCWMPRWHRARRAGRVVAAAALVASEVDLASPSQERRQLPGRRKSERGFSNRMPNTAVALTAAKRPAGQAPRRSRHWTPRMSLA